MPVRDPVHFIAVNLRVPSHADFRTYSDSIVKPTLGFCRAESVIGKLRQQSRPWFSLFLGMSVHPEMESPCGNPEHLGRGEDHLACGWSVDPFVFLAFSSGASYGGETNQRRVPSSLRSRSTPRIKLTDFVCWCRVRRRADLILFLDSGIIVFFRLALISR